jgi:hypothetical protein
MTLQNFYSAGKLEMIFPVLYNTDVAERLLTQPTPFSDSIARYPLCGSLELGFSFKGDGDDLPLSYDMVARTGRTPAELKRLATDNLYREIHPALAVKQLSLVPPEATSVEEGLGFFHMIETGGKLEASCILIAPIWNALCPLVQGDLRIVIPDRSTCHFCGTESDLTLAMMTDLAHDTYLNSITDRVSMAVFTVNEEGELSQVSLK